MISPYAKKGYIDHQTLSFDAYLKFIEDDFLGGQRLNPRTDGRPDPRPDVRENATQLGDLTADFDFTQQPRAPMILPVQPPTDLIAPASVARRRAAAGRTLALPRSGPLRSFELELVARRLGITSVDLKDQLAGGETLRNIAQAHGLTLAQLRRAVLAGLRAQVTRAIR